MRQGAEEACKECGYDLLFDGPANQDVTAQVNIVDRMIRQKVDALSICASDPSSPGPRGQDARNRQGDQGVVVG